MAQAPTLDGHIEETEWREAGAWSGLTSQNPGGNLLVPRPTTYFVGWDKANLYIACRTWILPGYKPRVGGRGPNEVTAFDDGLEFVLTPQGQNVPQGRAGSSYKFFVSALGNTGDVARVSVGQLFRTWAPQIKTAAALSPVGSAPRGGRWLDVEVALPAREFELTGDNRAGDVWRALLGFNHIPGFTQATIPINSAYFEAAPDLQYAARPAQLKSDKGIEVALWRLADRVLIGARNTTAATSPEATIKIDLDALNLTPQTKWQDFVRVRDFGATKDATQMDFTERTLTLPILAPGETRWIGVRRY